MADNTNILFPVEIINRELDARLFLAAFCACPGNRIFIGQFHAIHRLASAMRGGLYAGQNIFTQPFSETSFERYGRLKERGFKVVHVDEEGGVYEGDEERWRWRLRRRLDPTRLATDDHICTWGNFQRDFFLSSGPACAPNIRVTGHPRFDMYKLAQREYYARDAARLRERHGEFIIINTSWPMVNNAKGLSDTFSKRRGYDLLDSQRRYDHVSRWTHQTTVLCNFVRLITRLSIELPDLNFIIRPHPAENIAYYTTIFGATKNVQVVHEGNVAPWLLACRALIHDGCTTGIEAYFGDVPVINYKSILNARYDLFVPDLLGAYCCSEDEVLVALRAALNDERVLSASGPNEAAHAMIHNFRHDAFALLSEVILKVAASLPRNGASPVSLPQMAGERLRRRLRGARARFRAPREGKVREFYGFKNVDLPRKMETIGRLLNKDLKYAVHTEELMSVEANGS